MDDTKRTDGVTTYSTMVAIYPPMEFADLAKKHATDDLKDFLHVTLFYVGDTTPHQESLMIEALQEAMRSLKKPLIMGCEGAGAFLSHDGKWVRHLLMNGVGIDIWRFFVVQAFNRKGLLKSQTHGFIPHMTLEYHEGSLPAGWESCALEDYKSFPVESLALVREDDIIARIGLGGELLEQRNP